MTCISSNRIKIKKLFIQNINEKKYINKNTTYHDSFKLKICLFIKFLIIKIQ